MNKIARVLFYTFMFPYSHREVNYAGVIRSSEIEIRSLYSRHGMSFPGYIRRKESEWTQGGVAWPDKKLFVECRFNSDFSRIYKRQILQANF